MTAPQSTEQYATFNINSTVRVMLTPIGRKELQRQHDELRAKFPSLGTWTFRVEEDGRTEFQLWALMEQLGHLCHCGGSVPFETDIQLAKKDLR